MLVLSRKSGEAIVVGGNVKLRILEIQGDRVRIGIEAPREVPIHREEIYVRLANERAGLRLVGSS